MRSDQIYEAIGGIRESYLEESERLGEETIIATAEDAGAKESAQSADAAVPAGAGKNKNRRPKRLIFIYALAAAACLALLAGGLLAFNRLQKTPADGGIDVKESVAEAENSATVMAEEGVVSEDQAATEEAALEETGAKAQGTPDGGVPQEKGTDPSLLWEPGNAAWPQAASEQAKVLAAAVLPEDLNLPFQRHSGDETGEDGSKSGQSGSEASANHRLTDVFAGPEAAVRIAPAEGKNYAWSPVNLSIALSMLTEITDGGTRDEILNILGVSSIDELREKNAGELRDAFYDAAGQVSIPANSIWLRNDGTAYNTEVLQRLAAEYSATSFSGEMGSAEYDALLQDWLIDQTRGLLTKEAAGQTFDPQTIIALVSTIYYHADWDQFFEEHLVNDMTFHAPTGDRTVTGLSTTRFDEYYRGDHFGAARLYLRDGNSFWFLLPDEGYTPADVLSDPKALAIVKLMQEAEYEDAEILFRFPKFDVSSETDMKGILTALGVEDAFDFESADFSPLLGEEQQAAVTKIDHAARVAVDEYGVTAAAFTNEMAGGGDDEAQEYVELICDRPFVFAITNRNGLVFFEGVVCEP